MIATPNLVAAAVFLVLAASPAPAAPCSTLLRPSQDGETAQARKAADLARRRGDRTGQRELKGLVEDDPSDAASRALLALCQRDAGDWAQSRSNAERAWADAATSAPDVRAACGRALLAVLVELGDAEAAQRVVDGAPEVLQPEADARNAWWVGRTLALRGQRDAARAAYSAALRDASPDWRRCLARGRCLRALGDLQGASQALVEADTAAEAEDGREPDVLAETASLYFEADGEIEHREAAARVPGTLYRKALELHPSHEAALVGLFELGRFNWNRQSRPAEQILAELLSANPHSIEGLLAGAAADVDDGKLVAARAKLATLRELAPGRREYRTLEAALAWIEHQRDDCRAILTSLAESDPADSRPERELARHLNELYRFAEAAPFARAAVERDAGDWIAWMELGRALANTGDERGGLEALNKSQELAAGRQNAWRHNMIVVLERLQSKFVHEQGGSELSYSWNSEAGAVLRTYWMPFYAGAREELSKRYGYTPGPTAIQVFDSFQDFSVRSTGFEGFPALGVCFGPVVTSVSPQSELRGKFSWARTSFHEFTHVVHLGLSHNRCPRWITEGLATWEEEHKNPAWSRNMRRDLLDAYYNDDLIPVRDLNRAFRSQRILFGYYMSGQLCRMLIESRGFPPMVRLLEAFDQGQDLDAAIRGVFGLTPEALDAEFSAYVRRTIEPLAIEPRWSSSATVRRKLSLPAERPSDAARAQEWSDGWCAVAWGYWQNGKRVDAEQALRRLAQAGGLPPRALFLQGEMALKREDQDAARALYESGVAAGGEDYRVRMALGTMAVQREDWPEAEKQFLAAEQAFPGYAEAGFNAEMHLAQVYAASDREDDRFGALERYLKWNSDDYDTRLAVGRWHAEHGRDEPAARLFEEANEIDPFRRSLHVLWADSLAKLERYAEALREVRVAQLVPPQLDLEDPEPLSDAARAGLLGLEALHLVELERFDEAESTARRALELDHGEANAELALERLRIRRS